MVEIRSLKSHYCEFPPLIFLVICLHQGYFCLFARPCAAGGVVFCFGFRNPISFSHYFSTHYIYVK